MSGKTILVTGGTGKTGGRVAERLIEMGYGARVASRSGETRLAGAEAVKFDWMDERTYSQSLDGVSGIYLVAPLMEADPYPVMSDLVHRALEQGVKRFVLLSSSLLEEGGPAMGAVHKLLKEVAPEWSVLRPSWFMQNFSMGQHLPTIRDEGQIYTATDSGRVGFVDARDIAEVGVRGLVDPEPHNRDHIITGPEAISYDQVAEIISAACDKTVNHKRLTANEMIDRWVSFGMSKDYATMLTNMDLAIAAGAEDRVDNSVKTVTAKDPISFDDFARENADVWR